MTGHFTWNWTLAREVMPQLLTGLWVTLECVFFGMIVALVTGLVWAVLRRSRSRWISWPTGLVVELVRSTPLLVQLYLLYVILPGSISAYLSGILALGLHYGMYTSEVYRAGIDGVPRGQWEAAKALDLSKFQTYWHVVLPEAIPPVLPALGNYLIAMFKDAPLLIAIQVMELLNTATRIGDTRFNYVVPYTIVAVMYLGLALASESLVGLLERRLEVQT